MIGGIAHLPSGSLNPDFHRIRATISAHFRFSTSGSSAELAAAAGSRSRARPSDAVGKCEANPRTAKHVVTGICSD